MTQEQEVDGVLTPKEEVPPQENSPACAATSGGPDDSQDAKDVKIESKTGECSSSTGTRQLHIAVAGCVHGEMEKVYDTLEAIEKEQGYKFDLLICCGDYQSVRNFGDLHHMHVNEKFRDIQTFYKYYSGEKKAPILTVFVGGNHEATGYLLELPNGGWVAPNIYYMGFANVIQFGGLRIAGLSGIYKAGDYYKGHFERPPFADGSQISAYHARALEVFRLKQLRAADGEPIKNPIDIMITHDWPCGIANSDYGDVAQLLRVKPYFKDDIENGKLGNPGTMDLMFQICPRYWLSAHLHVGFAALVGHKERGGVKPDPTRFLALDKPIPRRHFVQALTIPVSESAPLALSYDPTWLAILKNTNNFTEVNEKRTFLPTAQNKEERWDFRPTEEEMQEVLALGDLTIPLNFQFTAPPIKAITPAAQKEGPSLYYKNPQSATFCGWLRIRDLNALLVESNPEVGVGKPFYITNIDAADSGEIDISAAQDDEDFGDDDFVIDSASSAVMEETRKDTTDEWQPPNPDFLANFEAPSLNISSSTLSQRVTAPPFKRPKVDDHPEEE